MIKRHIKIKNRDKNAIYNAAIRYWNKATLIHHVQYPFFYKKNNMQNYGCVLCIAAKKSLKNCQIQLRNYYSVHNLTLKFGDYEVIRMSDTIIYT